MRGSLPPIGAHKKKPDRSRGSHLQADLFFEGTHGLPRLPIAPPTAIGSARLPSRRGRHHLRNLQAIFAAVALGDTHKAGGRRPSSPSPRSRSDATPVSNSPSALPLWLPVEQSPARDGSWTAWAGLPHQASPKLRSLTKCGGYRATLSYYAPPQVANRGSAPKESPDRSRGIEATPWVPLERGSQFAG